ncbi:MAG: tRNA (adenosine(37)-N6)-threonylcarbamoyltransferase complex transferase subunit TsaD, partial [Chlamydiales bacterium]|nr:tRNA (adenosine(37)-N6)-threonylcarbamoyltransferase complex transferase subunit TsaD [Chlamydiales bacterium]
TAVSVIKATGSVTSLSITVLGNALFSQVKLHEEFGGVFPNLAKREHAKNLPPLLLKVLTQAKLVKKTTENQVSPAQKKKFEKSLKRENDASENFLKTLSYIKKPKIDAIAVTTGPGLEPALWVGIKSAEALGALWGIPVVPINHMEGHIMSVLLAKKTGTKVAVKLPTLSLLISGGHTELVYSKSILSYSILGQTRDDAVGEAYDKVARMMGIPYPGGPQIASMAEAKRMEGYSSDTWNLPRPMIYSKDLDFSFSGLKTAVLYAIKNKTLTEIQKAEIAKEFEDAVTEVLIAKTRKALTSNPTKTLIVAGGVASNTHIKQALKKLVKEFPGLTLHTPNKNVSTDNSIMIGIAGYGRIKTFPKLLKQKGALIASGNLRLSAK